MYFSSKGINEKYLYKIVVFVFVSALLLSFSFLTESFDVLCWISILQLGVNIYILVSCGYAVISLPMLFLIFSYVLHLGLLVVYVLAPEIQVPYFFDMFQKVSSEVLLYVFKYIIATQTFLTLGFLQSKMGKRIRFFNLKVKDTQSVISKKTIDVIACFFILVGIGPSLWMTIQRILLSASGNYLDTYSLNTNGILYYLSNLWAFGVVFLLISNRENKQKCRNILIVSIVYLCVSMFSGHRLLAVVLIIMFLYVYNLVVSKVNSKMVVTYGVVGYLLLLLINVIQQYRENYKNFLDVLTKYLSSGWIQPLWDVFANYGVTVSTMCYSYLTFPETGTWGFGLTYLDSFLTIVPGLTRISEGIEKHLMFTDNLYANYRAAIGGSYIAEAYYNFGIFGILFMFFIGMIIGNVSNRLVEAVKKGDWISFMCYISLFPFIIIWNRGYFRDLIRTFVWNFILILVIKIIVEKRFLKSIQKI